MSGVFICVISRKILVIKKGLSLDEYVQTCDAFILLNGPSQTAQTQVARKGCNVIYIT